MYDRTELIHHGIKGMRWGVRRFQNEDGSLNDKGKRKLESYQKRYAKQATRYEKYSNPYKQAKWTRKATRAGQISGLLMTVNPQLSSVYLAKSQKFIDKGQRYTEKASKAGLKMQKLEKKMNRLVN